MCLWCAGSDAEDPGPNACRPCLAEYEGMSVAELDRMEAEQAAELADWLG